MNWPFVFAVLLTLQGCSVFTNSEVCKSIDVRNTLDMFKQLEGCRVVEGFVQILLFDKVNETLLSQIRFPELTEITDYLLLYRVNGLRSIGQLFPNLAVIRGQNTFYSYALVVYDMASLQEIALHSLTNITHGQVRIDKNPSLCFLHSIDWDLIVHEKNENFVKSQKPENECPICPSDEMLKDDDPKNRSIISCPKKSLTANAGSNDRARHLCWNKQHCQRICPSHCQYSCNENGECCNLNCIGGCSVNDPNACTVCRNLSIGFGTNRQCLSHCPEGYYEYLERRCVQYDECIHMKRPLPSRGESSSELQFLEEFPYKIVNKSCILVLECPTNFKKDYVDYTCIPCEGIACTES